MITGLHSQSASLHYTCHLLTANNSPEYLEFVFPLQLLLRDYVVFLFGGKQETELSLDSFEDFSPVCSSLCEIIQPRPRGQKKLIQSES